MAKKAWDNERLRVKSNKAKAKAKAVVDIVGEASDGIDKSTPLGRKDYRDIVMRGFDSLDQL